MDFDEVKSLVGEFFNGQYEVKKFLGEGSFAKVYLVRHNYLDDLRAMKIIKEPISQTTNVKSVFSEVMLATRLRHENIISIFDAGIISEHDENLAFFVMEYVRGGDLEQYLNSFVSSGILMPVSRALDLIRQILNGLNTLHGASPPIVHRDLKPNNILLSYNSCGDIVVKISDFGFAKEVTTRISDIDIVGTRPYMAPECFTRKVSQMTDIYAVGVIFYQLLTNSYPFDIDSFTVEELLDSKPWQNPPKPPSHYNEMISKDLDEIVMKCLSANPEKRYANASELLGDVEKVIDSFKSPRPINTVGALDDDEYGDCVINDSLIKAFALAKRENGLGEAIGILESEVLNDYQVRRCYGETLRMWKSKNPDIKLISKAFTVNLTGKNYGLSCELMAEAIASNPSLKSSFAPYIELWEILIGLSGDGNLIKAVIALEELMDSNERINEIYSSVISTLKTYSVEEIVAQAIRLAGSNDLIDAANLMEFAVVCNPEIRDRYAYKMSLWKQNMKSGFRTDSKFDGNAMDYAVDLGTTDSVMAYFNRGNPTIIKNRITGDEFTPSAVLIDEEDAIHVGEDARLALFEDSRNAISEFKNNMGFPVSFNFQKSSREMLPEELSAEILKDLRISAYHQCGVNVDCAVICVPANSNYLKTRAINDAADLAGFRSHSLIPEPVAVAVAYGLESNCLIYDLGGATFSASLVGNNDGEIEKIDSMGFDDLGGNTFDWAIVDEIFVPKIAGDLNLDDFRKSNPKYGKVFSRLRIASEISKRELSKSMKTDICIDNLIGDYDFTCTLTRDRLKQIIMPLIEPTFNLARKLLEDNSITSDNVDRIILVGGSCLSPVVRDLLGGEFDIPLEYGIDPLTVVARGASIYAGSLKRPQVDVDVDSFSLILDVGKDHVRGRAFAMDEKFSFLGCGIEFVNVESGISSGRIPIGLDGTFGEDLPMGEYEISVYDGDSPVEIDVKSPSSIRNDEIWIEFFKKSYKTDDSVAVDDLKNRFNRLMGNIAYLREYARPFDDGEILEYVERLIKMAKIDENASMLSSLYLDYLEGIVSGEMDGLDFLKLLGNVESKIDVAKRKNLFDVDDLNLDDVIEKGDYARLKEIHNTLVERYVELNREDVIVSCFVSLKSEGVYSENEELFLELSERASAALDNHDYGELLEIVNGLHEIDERGYHER